MKKNTCLIMLLILTISSCGVDKNEMALLYNNQILNSYNEVTEALNLFFEATNNDINELKKSHQTAIRITETAIKNLELIEDVEKGNEFKESTLNYMKGTLKILNEYGVKIISFREVIDKQYSDSIIDSLNTYVVLSYDILDSLTINFDNAHKKFTEHYSIKNETDSINGI